VGPKLAGRRAEFKKNTSRGVKDKLLQLFGFCETTSLGKYLGVPLLGKVPKKEDYNQGRPIARRGWAMSPGLKFFGAQNIIFFVCI
jgi:hypothetical protein